MNKASFKEMTYQPKQITSAMLECLAAEAAEARRRVEVIEKTLADLAIQTLPATQLTNADFLVPPAQLSNKTTVALIGKSAGFPNEYTLVCTVIPPANAESASSYVYVCFEEDPLDIKPSKPIVLKSQEIRTEIERQLDILVTDREFLHCVIVFLNWKD